VRAAAAPVTRAGSRFSSTGTSSTAMPVLRAKPATISFVCATRSGSVSSVQTVIEPPPGGSSPPASPFPPPQAATRAAR
jgi:hypothetical protein